MVANSIHIHIRFQHNGIHLPVGLLAAAEPNPNPVEAEVVVAVVKPKPAN